jgi:hypothetical protein
MQYSLMMNKIQHHHMILGHMEVMLLELQPEVGEGKLIQLVG